MCLSTLSRVSARAFAVFMGVLAVVGLLAFGLISKGTTSIAVGETVPAPELETLDGQGSGSIADYRGRWVLLNVWASWCRPCREESPVLERFDRAHRDQGFTVVGVDTQDNSQDATAFVRELDITYPQLHEDGDGYAKDELGTTGVPESFLVDPTGRLAVHYPGQVTEDYLDEVVLPYLTGASGA